MDHHRRLAAGSSVWSSDFESPGAYFSSSSLGMGRALGPSSDVDILRLYDVYLIPQCDSPGGGPLDRENIFLGAVLVGLVAAHKCRYVRSQPFGFE